MDKIGAFTFVLHSHLPYCRRAGRWPHGEEWLHEAAAETYIPLLNALYDLHEAGLPARLTLGLTPILCEQLADPLVQEHFEAYLGEKIQAAEGDISRFREEENTQAEYLAIFYRDWYSNILHSFQQRYNRDIVGAFRRLQDAGVVEIITCAATHGYLPLLGTGGAIRGQLKAGIVSYKRHFGRAPRALWLPECAYRPAYVADDGTARPGLESFLAAENLGCFLVETHTIEGGRPVGKAAGDAIGPYGAIVRNYVLPLEQFALPDQPRSTYRPYYVVNTTPGVVSEHSGVAAIGRNNRTGMQVWSADWGYPGDYDYREFHKKDHISGLQYWRVTGAQVDLGHKDWYHPDWAQGKVGEHSRHFAWLVSDLLTQYHDETGQFGIIASNYDTELFGHWWFEGVGWICEVLRHLASSESVTLMTVSEYLEAHPPDEVLALPESSWGLGGGHWTWDNPETHWMWQPIHEAEKRIEQIASSRLRRERSVERLQVVDPDEEVVLNQAARELLLLESSDWLFLVTTGQAREYAIQRFTSHVERFERLIASVEVGHPDRVLADELWELDKVFPDVDYRWWAK
jgi:1,4-alpha-glucan branching enzyme